MPTKWSQKRLDFLRTSIFASTLLLSFSVCAQTPLVNENITDSDVIEMLALPVKERIMRLKDIPEIRDRLKKFAFDGGRNLDVRWSALTALGAIGGRSARWEIEAALKDHDWFMRNAGLIAAQHDEREFAIQWSKALLKDPALVVRTQAVKNLIELGAEAREEIWVSLFAKNNYTHAHGLWIRGYMAKALASWATNKDQKRFLRLLMDEDKEVQRWAIIGLEKSTGWKLSSPTEPIDVQKHKWMARLSSSQI